MNEIDNRFADNLEHLLRKHKMTQRALATKLGRSYQYVNELVRGKNTPSLELMKAIASAFDVDINDMLSTNLAAMECNATYGSEPLTWVPYLEVKPTDDSVMIRASASRAPFAFRTDWLYQLGSPDSMVFVRTTGKKLDDELPDNAHVLVDRSQKMVINGAPYMIRTGKELHIKRITKKGEDLVIHDDIYMEKGREKLEQDGDWEVLGRCVWYNKLLN
jgi:transcriptional regulator with XRE-family HTH domain